MMTCNCIESERFLLRVKIKGEPDVSIRAVARNIFRWAKTVNRKTLSKHSAYGPCYRKINSAPTTEGRRFGAGVQRFPFGLLRIS